MRARIIATLSVAFVGGCAASSAPPSADSLATKEAALDDSTVELARATSDQFDTIDSTYRQIGGRIAERVDALELNAPDMSRLSFLIDRADATRGEARRDVSRCIGDLRLSLASDSKLWERSCAAADATLATYWTNVEAVMQGWRSAIAGEPLE